MSAVSVLICDPVHQKVFAQSELRLTVTAASATEIYEEAINKFNNMSGTTLVSQDFLFLPNPEVFGNVRTDWARVSTTCPNWNAVLKPSGQQAVSSSLDARIAQALASNSASTDEKIQAALASQQEVFEKKLSDAVDPLHARIAVLEQHRSLTSPLLIRKVVYKSRQQLIEAIAPGTYQTVENFKAWLALQDKKRVLTYVTEEMLSCICEWGPVDGSMVAHNEVKNETPLLAAAIEELGDSPAKTVLQAVFLFAFKKAPAAAAADIDTSVNIDLTKPGLAIIGKDRNKGRFRGFFCTSAEVASASAVSVPTARLDLEASAFWGKKTFG